VERLRQGGDGVAYIQHRTIGQRRKRRRRRTRRRQKANREVG
jgi:hypothetical protein